MEDFVQDTEWPGGRSRNVGGFLDSGEVANPAAWRDSAMTRFWRYRGTAFPPTSRDRPLSKIGVWSLAPTKESVEVQTHQDESMRDGTASHHVFDLSQRHQHDLDVLALVLDKVAFGLAAGR